MILLFKFNRVTILETWDNLIIICADLSCTHITQSVKVGCNFQLSVLVKLGAVLLLKLHQMQCASTFVLCVNSLEKLTRCEVVIRQGQGCQRMLWKPSAEPVGLQMPARARGILGVPYRPRCVMLAPWQGSSIVCTRKDQAYTHCCKYVNNLEQYG